MRCWLTDWFARNHAFLAVFSCFKTTAITNLTYKIASTSFSLSKWSIIANPTFAPSQLEKESSLEVQLQHGVVDGAQGMHVHERRRRSINEPSRDMAPQSRTRPPFDEFAGEPLERRQQRERGWEQFAMNSFPCELAFDQFILATAVVSWTIVHIYTCQFI